MRVAIQGETGSFHHLAARRWYGETVEIVDCDSFAAVFAAVKNGRADEAVVAIENSLYGSINEVYDLLKHYSYPIIGELNERIHQNLITLLGTTLPMIKTIMSHPVALAQCSDFLNRELPGAERVEYHDTAGSLRKLIELNDLSVAAISSTFSAELMHLPILQTKIENAHQNYTRFLVLSPAAKPPVDADKASLVLQTTHTQGALWRALSIFANAGVNLLKLQSRPVPGSVWKYQFYLDVAAAGSLLQNCIDALATAGCKVSRLGEYRAAPVEHED
jgi:prephenate dehydratase